MISETLWRGMMTSRGGRHKWTSDPDFHCSNGPVVRPQATVRRWISTSHTLVSSQTFTELSSSGVVCYTVISHQPLCSGYVCVCVSVFTVCLAWVSRCNDRVWAQVPVSDPCTSSPCRCAVTSALYRRSPAHRHTNTYSYHVCSCEFVQTVCVFV